MTRAGIADRARPADAGPRVPARMAPAAWLLSFAAFAAVSGLHLGAKLAGLHEFDAATKRLLMPALLIGVVAALALRLGRLRAVDATLLGLAIALSWAGDVTIADLLVGLPFFLAAHIAYIVLFQRLGIRRVSWWALLAVPWFAVLLAVLWGPAGAMLPAVALYGVVLGAMAAWSTRVSPLTAAGGILFVVSDSLLAFRLFTPLLQSAPEDALIMTTYLAAQLLIAVGLLRSGRRPTAGEE